VAPLSMASQNQAQIFVKATGIAAEKILILQSVKGNDRNRKSHAHPVRARVASLPKERKHSHTDSAR
jgi:hypothetical protein